MKCLGFAKNLLSEEMFDILGHSGNVDSSSQVMEMEDEKEK